MRLRRLGPALLAGCAAALAAAVAPVRAAEGPWRSGWTSLADSEKVIAAAEELGFQALITHGPSEKLEQFAKDARAHGIDCYVWVSATPAKGEEALAQVMSPEENAARARVAADPDPRKSGYQFGGEPLPGRQETLLSPLLCFDRPEAVAVVRQRIRDVLVACPTLAGVAFDYFGYQNYRCCRCPESERLFAEWQAGHPGGTRDEFSLERLVAFYNETADYVRSVRPGLKVTAHLYPVFFPEPLYGRRLKLDSCCQTVSWYFLPFWPEQKVRRYTRSVTAGPYGAGGRGIPFVALYVSRPEADVPPERFAQVLDWVFAEGGTSLSIYDFRQIALHDDYRQILKDALARHH